MDGSVDAAEYVHPDEYVYPDSLLVDEEKPSDEVKEEDGKSQEEAERLNYLREKRENKAKAIQRACERHDLDALVAYATSEGGFIDDQLRRLAWPIILGCDREDNGHDLARWEDLPRHDDEGQIRLDVDRSFVYYPRGEHDLMTVKKKKKTNAIDAVTDEELYVKRNELTRLILQVLRNYPMLCYFQGYHDIAQVLLLVLGEEQAAPAVRQISLFRIRDYMLPSLTPAVKHLQLIPEIIKKKDVELGLRLSTVQPFFALASTLTLYAHDVEEYADIARLFDFILAHEPIVTIYFFAAIVLSRKKELLAIPVDEPDILHVTLSKLPRPFDLEGLISYSMELFEEYPPESLPSSVWKRIPPSSVLKTSRTIFDDHTAHDAVILFSEQTRQLRNEEMRNRVLSSVWRHRKAIGSVGLAILVAAVSFWIRRKGFDGMIWSYIGQFKGILRLWRKP